MKGCVSRKPHTHVLKIRKVFEVSLLAGTLILKNTRKFHSSLESFFDLLLPEKCLKLIKKKSRNNNATFYRHPSLVRKPYLRPGI